MDAVFHVWLTLSCEKVSTEELPMPSGVYINQNYGGYGHIGKDLPTIAHSF